MPDLGRLMRRRALDWIRTADAAAAAAWNEFIGAA
jgi:hypothetical protein